MRTTRIGTGFNAILVMFAASAFDGSHGWAAEDELLLYVVHGLLHLCGYDDLTDGARPVMRRRERQVLAYWQLTPTGLEA